MNEPAQMQAVDTLVIGWGPRVRVIHRGTILESNDPAVIANPHLFSPATEEVNQPNA